jgi:hypothetical protein
MPTLAYLLNDNYSKVFVPNQSLIKVLGFRDALKVNSFMLAYGICRRCTKQSAAPLAAFESEQAYWHMVYGNFKALAYGILDKYRYGIRHIQFEICQYAIILLGYVPLCRAQIDSHVVIFINRKSAYV